jgi:hypothetical protein
MIRYKCKVVSMVPILDVENVEAFVQVGARVELEVRSLRVTV